MNHKKNIDEYIDRIVISTDLIATDTKDNDHDKIIIIVNER